MPVRIGNSYVSEAAAQFAMAEKETKEVKEGEGKGSNKGSGVLADLAEKFPGLKITVGTQPFSGSGLKNLSISPKILREMERDPEKRMEYEALIYDVANFEAPQGMSGRTMKSHGFIIGNDGGLSSWSVSTTDDGLHRSRSSVKRSDKKNWWQQILESPKKKKASSTKTRQEKMLEKAREKKAEKAESEEERGLKLLEMLQQEQADAEKNMSLPYQGNPALAKAYLQNNQTAPQSNAFSNVKEFSRYLQENFTVAKEGLTSISGKYLRECLTDEEKRQKLFDNLQAADEMLASRQGEVGFQGMRVRIDEDGEMSVESSKSTVTINENKSRRQIAAAATKGDMQAVLARLQQDLQAVEDGLKQNMCDGAEVEKAKKLIEQAKQRMAKLPDRAPTPEEQSLMAVNMLI